MSGGLDLFLFTPEPDVAMRAAAAGVAGIVIDWERAGKAERQEAADTEINRDTVDDLAGVRAATDARIVCRINPLGASTPDEIEAAVEGGADEVLVPMIRTPDEVAVALELARARVGVGILVETVSAVECATSLGRLSLARAYVGLNDLRIERCSASIFTAVRDGTVERVRTAFDVPFGFAGLTLPELGDPIPCRLLMAELARLRCKFTFLRRSFRRDVVGRRLDVEVPRMEAALRAAFGRSEAEVARDRRALELRIAEMESEAGPLAVSAVA